MYYDYGGGPCLDGLQKARGMLIPPCVPAIAAPLPSSVFIPPSSPPLVADESSHGIVLTPGAIGLIFVTIMALLLVCLCSTEVTKGITWSRRHGSNVGSAPVVQRTAAPMISLGLAEWGIMRIPVAKYKKEGGQRIESMECAVCLSPFEEDESVRMLPQCGHAFHLPCIDEWLQRHSNCPLCRMEITLDTIKALMQQLIPATSGIDHESAPQERDPSEITEMAENRHILGVEFNSNVATSQLELPGGEVAMLAGYACRSSDERPATKLQGEDQANVQAPSTSNCFTDRSNYEQGMHSARIHWQAGDCGILISLRRSISTGSAKVAMVNCNWTASILSISSGASVDAYENLQESAAAEQSASSYTEPPPI